MANMISFIKMVTMTGHETCPSAGADGFASLVPGSDCFKQCIMDSISADPLVIYSHSIEKGNVDISP